MKNTRSGWAAFFNNDEQENSLQISYINIVLKPYYIYTRDTTNIVIGLHSSRCGDNLK